MSRLKIGNADARRLFLDRHALNGAPAGRHNADTTLDLIHRLGFVQLDSVNAVERAHHLILFSRAPAYRREHLAALHHDEASLFEHWTHDASLVPTEFYPHWRHRFRAAKARIATIMPASRRICLRQLQRFPAQLVRCRRAGLPPAACGVV